MKKKIYGSLKTSLSALQSRSTKPHFVYTFTHTYMPLFRRFRMSLYGRLSCLCASLILRPCFPYARVYLRPGASLSRFNCRASEQIRGRASSWWYYTHAELNERRWRSRRRCWVTSGRADSRVCMYVYIWEPLPQAAAQPTLRDAQIYVFFFCSVAGKMRRWAGTVGECILYSNMRCWLDARGILVYRF